jgi:hypothetical protein
MTEAEWLTCRRVADLLYSSGAHLQGRKGLLFACACCRRIWHLFSSVGHRVVESVERYADGASEPSELLALPERIFELGDVVVESLPGADQAIQVIYQLRWQWDRLQTHRDTGYLVASVSRAAAEAHAKSVPWDDAREPQADLLRDVIRSPFRPSPPVARSVLAWNDATVRRIAEGIYDERAFDRLPILADALLDAGCDNDDLIQHCRSAGPHVRGCWAVDLILGKS